MKVIIYPYSVKSRRIKFFIPLEMEAIRKQVKQLNTTWYHPFQKQWSVVNTSVAKKALMEVIKGQWALAKVSPKVKVINREVKLSEGSQKAIIDLEQKIVLKGYSRSTLKTYKNFFYKFLCYFNERDLYDVKKEEIEAFMYKMLIKEKLYPFKKPW